MSHFHFKKLKITNEFSGEILCRFFDGLRGEFKSPTTESFANSIRLNAVHRYFQDEKRFEQLELPKDRVFDEKFFAWIISEFAK